MRPQSLNGPPAHCNQVFELFPNGAQWALYSFVGSPSLERTAIRAEFQWNYWLITEQSIPAASRRQVPFSPTSGITEHPRT